MNNISLVDLEVFAYHGVFDFEKKDGQTFYLTCVAQLTENNAGFSDALEDALDYGALAHRLTDLFQEKTFDLIERAAEHCTLQLLQEFPLIQELTLTIKKPSAPIGLPLQYPALTISRRWHNAMLALGSNIEPRQDYINQALASLQDHPLIRLIKSAPIIETAPVGYTDQASFLNTACQIQTLLPPHELLKATQAIENESGRIRTIHWGPRTLDIDIIYYDDILLHSDDLVIPHPLSHERRFVLAPLVEINPYWIDPRFHLTVSTLLQKLKEE